MKARAEFRVRHIPEISAPSVSIENMRNESLLCLFWPYFPKVGVVGIALLRKSENFVIFGKG